MELETESTRKLNCSRIVVVRWDPPLTENDVLEVVRDSGVKTEDTLKRSQTLAKNGEAVLFLRLESEVEAAKVDPIGDSSKNPSSVRINRLIEPNGIRLRDAVDFMRFHRVSSESDMDLLLGLIRLELPERSEMANGGLGMIREEIARLVENGTCIPFGSFSHPVRRNGYSDVDLCVESVDDEGNVGSTSVRPLQELIDNPKILLDSPLTKAEFYSYPQTVIIKALAECFQENQEFRQKFKMRTLLVRTPIIIFKSHENGMGMSYDVSVNNEISVEKTNILNLFITKDTSREARTRKVLMFAVFWAKANRLTNGTYPDEMLPVKTGLWSYIINQLVFHFIQVVANKPLVHPNEKGDDRVSEYNFDRLFGDYTRFFLQFFAYFACFDYAKNAIHGKEVIEKNGLVDFEKSLFMLIDPMDDTHNITSSATEEALGKLRELCRNAVFILEKEQFRVDLLLRTNESARELRQIETEK